MGESLGSSVERIYQGLRKASGNTSPILHFFFVIISPFLPHEVWLVPPRMAESVWVAPFCVLFQADAPHAKPAFSPAAPTHLCTLLGSHRDAPYRFPDL